MTVDDANKVIEQLRTAGHSDDEILYSFSRLYFENKIDLDGFNGLVNMLGYHLDDEFLKMSKEEQYKWFMGNK